MRRRFVAWSFLSSVFAFNPASRSAFGQQSAARETKRDDPNGLSVATQRFADRMNNRLVNEQHGDFEREKTAMVVLRGISTLESLRSRFGPTQETKAAELELARLIRGC